MIRLRDYQEDLVDKIRGAIREGHRRILAVLETGGGKTIIAGYLAREISMRGKEVWFCGHRDFLLDQTSLTFEKVEIAHGFIAAKRKCFLQPVMICAVETLRRRLEGLKPPDVLFLDEAHHVAAGSWNEIVQWAGEKCIIIGLTATPERLDGRGLGPPFQVMVFGPTYTRLRTDKHLSDFRAFIPTTIDRKKLSEDEVAGDFNVRAAEAMVEAQVVVSDIISWYRKLTADMPESKAIYFCCSIAHSKRTAERFCAAGIPFAHLDGDASSEERRQVAQALARGELAGITNCSLLGEGFDLAAQAQIDVTIDVVGLLRPTESLALHRQQMGRGLRAKTYPGLIIDHVGNIKQHGTPSEACEWALEGRPKKKTGVSIMKDCPSCFAAVPISARSCPECGEVFESEGKGEAKGIEGVLTEIREEEFESERRKRAIRKARKAVIDACKTYEDFRRAQDELGYKSGWARLQWASYQAEQELATARAEQQYDYYRRGDGRGRT